MTGRALRSTIGFVIFSLIFALIALALRMLFHAYVYDDDVRVDAPAKGIAYIIDAGHGGADGGARASDGTNESGLNLDTALILRDLLRISGFGVIMTRENDGMLDDGGSGTAKLRDLRSRLNLMRAYPDSVFVSVHMNKFPETRYYGLQVWYAPNNELSGKIALSVQQSAQSLLDPNNTRQIKAATSAIYLLDRTQNPAVLVECGFLSNEAELALLKTHEYRQKLAAAILCGLRI